jgi:hypothetical protein
VRNTSKFALAHLETSANVQTAAVFLEALIEAVPYQIHTVLTDNGTQFATCRPAGTARPPGSASTCSTASATTMEPSIG